MKKIHFIIALVILQFIGKESFSQHWIYFTGQVTEIESGDPVPDYPVIVIISDSVYLANIYTDHQGEYYDSVFIDPAGIESVEVGVFDCNAILISQYFQEVDSINVADFSICVNDNNCFAFFDYQPEFTDPYTIHFFNLSQGDFTTWEWDFGDGNYSNEFNPVHLYNSTGIFEVCLSIHDSTGICEDTFCGFIVIADSICVADYYWEQDAEDPLLVNFTDLSTGEVTEWLWDFGDMIYSEEQSPTHQYASTGEYLVMLTIMDSMQICYDVISQWVDIWDSTYCTAEFNTELDTLNNIPYVYLFEDISDGNPESWLWDFGDGQITFDQHTSHVYEQAGTYEVCLTVSSNNGVNDCFDKECQTINTPEYFNFGGQVFIGDYPLNIEEDDSSNMAIAYLYRRYINQWELMDTREFWKFGYYWFTDKPEGEYIIRTDLIPGSLEFGRYTPVYHNNTTSWTEADIFMLSNDEEFAINTQLKPLTAYQTGIGSISGHLEPGLDCEMSMPLERELVYLLNANHQTILITYTNEFGIFTFEGLGLTRYFVKAEVTGKQSPRVGVQLTENNPSNSDVLLDVECNSYVGIDEYQTFSNLTINNIFPQPASDRFSIDMNTLEESTCQFEIISIDGKTMWMKNMNTRSGNSIIDINVSSFKSGLYLLKVSDLDGNGIKTRKIIIN